MTVMLDKPSIPLHGSMLPRVYTPPLEVNLIGPSRDEYGTMQECPCGCGLSPDTSYGFSCCSFLTRVMKWKLMPWQRWLYIHALEKKPDRSCFRFQTTVVLVARQQGKTKWLKGLGLWRLFLDTDGNEPTAECPNALLAIIAAQNLDYAETMLKEVVDDIREHPLLRKELVNHRVTNGKHRAILTNKRYWRAATATRKGARSLSVDIAMLDELREHTTSDAWNAITATTTVRPLSQVIAASNAGDQRSEVLRSLRDSATRRIATKETADSQTALFEWSVPMDVDPRNPAYWYMANPSMGHLNEFTIDDLRGRLEAMEYRNMPGFQTEHLCQWVDALEPGIIPAEHWQETLDPVSRRDETAKVYAALDVNYERSRSFIAIAARRPDGKLHVEVIQAARGTEWVVPWLQERKGKFAAVAVQKTGAPASGMIDDLRRAGLKVVEWGPGTEIVAGSGMFYDLIVQHEVYHRPAPLLDRAAGSAIARRVADGWIFDRRNSPVDVSPLVACAAAVWAEHSKIPGPPTVHSWPDEEEMKQWEKEAAEAWQETPKQTEQNWRDSEEQTWWPR